MPFFIPTLIFAISLSLLPSTETIYDDPPESSRSVVSKQQREEMEVDPREERERSRLHKRRRSSMSLLELDTLDQAVLPNGEAKLSPVRSGPHLCCPLLDRRAPGGQADNRSRPAGYCAASGRYADVRLCRSLSPARPSPPPLRRPRLVIRLRVATTLEDRAYGLHPRLILFLYDDLNEISQTLRPFTQPAPLDVADYQRGR